MQPNTVNAHHDTDPRPLAAVPPELLETVAWALAGAHIPPPRRPPPHRKRSRSRGLPDRRAARPAAGNLPGDRPRLAIAGTLPHTVVCQGARKTTRRYPRRFAEEFAASGLEVADLAAYAAAWRARVTAPAR